MNHFLASAGRSAAMLLALGLAFGSLFWLNHLQARMAGEEIVMKGWRWKPPVTAKVVPHTSAPKSDPKTTPAPAPVPQPAVTQIPEPTVETPPLVYVDAGHGGMDGGAVAHGITEKVTALDLAKRVAGCLQDAGVKVIMTREDDTFIALEERANLANRAGADLFVSLHLNTSGGEDDALGIETYYAPQKALSARLALRELIKINANSGILDTRSERLAETVQRFVCRKTGAQNRGVKERNYAVVYRTVCPSILVECGFITHSGEAARLKTISHRDKVAQGVADGVVAFLRAQEADPSRGLKFKAPVAETPDRELLTGP